MLTVRLTVIFLTFGLCISNASGQNAHSSIVSQPRPSKLVHSDDHTLSLLPFTVALSGSNQAQVSSDSTYTFYCQVANSSKENDTLYFKRSQQLPEGWNTSVCLDPGECYADRTDSVIFVLSPNTTLNDNIILSLNVDPALNNVPDSTVVWLRVGIVGSPEDTVMLPFYITFIPPNPPLVFQWSGISGTGPSFDTTFGGAGEYSIDNLFENEFGLGANYNFTIQDSLPQGWSLTTCIQNDYADTCTTGNDLTVNFSDYNDSTFQQAVKFTLNVPSLTATDSAIIYFGVHPKISAPADSATYRFSIVVQNISGVTPQPAEQSGMVVTNAWPNPLHSASTLHINVQTGQEGPVTVGIYDLDGVLQSTLEFGSLNAGSNDLQATMPELPSGEYIIRIQQGNDTPEIVRINYIK